MNVEVFSGLFSNVWSIFLVILFFGGSIFVHELGHFIAARRRGLKVERFSIGFGPKLFGWKKDGIDYRVSLLPLGGYVALPQLADLSPIEGKPEKTRNQLPPISYADKMIVSVMGAVFNLIFAFILATVLWIIGQPSSMEQQTTTIGYVSKTIKTDIATESPGPAFIAGLRPGDTILKVDGKEVNNFRDIQQLILIGTGRNESGDPLATLTIERAGKRMKIEVSPKLVQVNPVSGDNMRSIGATPRQSLIIGGVFKNSPAELAGIKEGDELIAANNTRLYSLMTLSDIIAENPDQPINLTIERHGKQIELLLLAKQVPYTKPLGLLSIADQQNSIASIKLLTISNTKEPSALLNPKTEGQLVILDLPNINGRFEGLKAGQIIDTINGQTVNSLASFTQALDSNTGNNLLLGIQQNGNLLKKSLSANGFNGSILEPRKKALIGIQLLTTPLITHVNPFTQFSENIAMMGRTLQGLFHSQSDVKVSNLMGSIGIMRVLHTFSTQDLRLLLWFVVLLNINLAILNLLPIPVLDGGQMLFATISKLRGKGLPVSFVAATQGTFMILLFSLMLYVTFFDVRRWQGESDFEEQMNLQRELYIPTVFNFEKE